MEHYQLNGTPSLLVLDGENGRILAFTPEGRLLGALLDDCGGTPDGIAVDHLRGHIYWTNMGEDYDQNDGFIERVDLDGGNRTMIIPPGKTFTPKQLKIDEVNGLLYWCDREGMRIMRASLDGTGITTLLITGRTEADRLDETLHCVGIAVDLPNNYLYWTQKGPSDGGQGRIFRAPLNPAGNYVPDHRKDIELLFDHLPEPIDLDMDLLAGHLYWTDRGAPPEGNSVNRADLKGHAPLKKELLLNGLQEAIGLSLDVKNSRMYFCDLGGNIYCSRIGSQTRCQLHQGDGRFTGLVYYDPERLSPQQ